MESIPLKKIRKLVKKIRKLAEAYDKKLLANDKRFRRDVTLIHKDGSVVHYSSAFLMKTVSYRAEWKDYESHLSNEPFYWVICFTEHHGLHITYSDDLLLYWESERRIQLIEELK